MSGAPVETKDSKARTLTVKTVVLIPTVPNFLMTLDGKIPVSAITDEGLRQIGADWTEALIATAARQRKESRR